MTALTVNTAIIQQAIDSVSNNGGGEVIISGGGIYSSTTIVLQSNVTLRITAGTTLKALRNNTDYPDILYDEPSWSEVYTKKSLIFAENAHNIRITGGGTIDGNGVNIPYLAISQRLRPFGLRLHKITNLTIDSINLRQAPQWMGHINHCTNVHIHDVNVYNQGLGANDGIDIDGCENVLVENCTFDTNDDPIPVKTHGFYTCRDVLIRNCTMATYERAVKVGNETFGPIVNVKFENITVNSSSFGLGIKPLNAIYCAVADGGSMDSIFFENITVNAPSEISIFLRLCDRGWAFDNNPHPTVKYLRNVWFKNITDVNATSIPCSVTGIPGHQAENIHFENVNITIPGGGAVVSGNVPEMEQTRPEGDIWGDSLPAYGLYVRHVNGLCLDGYTVTQQAPDVRPLYVFEDTVNIYTQGDCPEFVTSGISAVGNASAEIFPNPASDILFVKQLSFAAENATLYNSFGAAVKTVYGGGKSAFSLNVSDVASGIYFLNINGKVQSLQRKIVIVR